ncbi:MAG: hypothetical protein WCL50_15345, partial [Spirochaetota bacterium]
MKARLVPLYFKSGMDAEYKAQLETVKALLKDEAELLPPAALGSKLPEADACLFPQLIGDAFKQLGQLKALGLPLIMMTSEFGTV